MSSFSVSFRPYDAGNASAEAPAAGEPTDSPVCVLDLTGELDAHTANEFEAALQKCLDEGHTRLVVSGRELQYISSAGLGVFMAFVEPVREAGGDIKIAALQPRVFNVFDLLGFPLLFDIEESEEAAVARFSGSPADAS